MELWGECMLDLCIVAIQNTKLVVIAMHMLPCYYTLTSITVCTPYTDHKYCSAHAYVIRQYHSYCMLLQVQVVKFSLSL